MRAKNGSSFSGYSNVVSTITPNSIVYINFNMNVPNAAYAMEQHSNIAIVGIYKVCVEESVGYYYSNGYYACCNHSTENLMQERIPEVIQELFQTTC